MDLVNNFPVGRPVDVYVTHVQDDSGNFFVQINNEEAGKLDELMEEIDAFISSGQSQVLMANDAEVGMVYLAQYSVDAKWYRARVKAVISDGLCDVHFIDYGNTEQIPIKFLCRAQQSFLQLHQQALECELEGISKFRGPRLKSAISTLKELILDQELVCMALSVSNGVLLSKLFTDQNISNSIIDSLLSKVQRTPQQVPNDSANPSLTSKKYSIVSLAKGEYVDFHVSSVQDPYNFSCQLLEEIPKILDLLDNLAEEYCDFDVPLLSSSPGYPCCAKFYEDDCWYRAVITNSNSVASGSIDVKFVDYGNLQTTSLKDVKGLKDKYLNIPVQAIECSLYGVRPGGQSKDWSTPAKDLFSKLTSEKHIIAEICDQESSGKYQVRLTDMTGDMDMQLDQILIAAKYAEKIPTNPSLTTTSKLNNNIHVSKPSSYPMSPFTKESIYPGKEEKVLVSSICSPSEFYCMLYRTSPKLEKQMSEIARYYSGLSRDDEWLSSPLVGDPCCARFSDDKSWYRAIVKEVHSSGKVKVQFVDYGNYDTVVPKDVKRLAPQFSELPCQAVRCALHRICPDVEDWRQTDIKLFEDLALEYTGKLTVISENADGVKSVELLISLKGKEINIAEAMLLSRNARLVEGACAQSENLPSITSKKFPALNLPLGTYEDIFVTHVDDPANFWCQLVKHKDELDAVMNVVEEHCVSMSTPLRFPSLGLACCAKYSDNAWYRANVSGVMKTDQVEVHFVDYGNYDTVPLSRLRSMRPELMNLPAQAFKCRLEQIDNNIVTSFSNDVIDKFIDITVDKELVGMIASYDETKQQYIISCTDTSGGDTVDVYEQIAPLLPQSTIKECIVPKQDLKPGQREHVCITTVTGLSKFYCQVMRTASQFDAMMGTMDEQYKKLTTMQDDMAGLKPGDYCVAKYSEDNSWYRAKIMDSKITVHYIDFGNGEQLSAKSIKRIAPAFVQIPEQAVSCSLAGDITGLSDSQFVDLTLDNEFDMEVISIDNNGHATVNLYTRDTKKSVSHLLEKEKPKLAINIQENSLAVGTKVTVYVSFASDVSKFYVQFSKSADPLAELMNEIYEHYSSIIESQDALGNPQVGMFCIANFSEDNGWYRAKVTAVHADSLQVLYVDYGNSEVLPPSRTKAIKHNFVQLPSQAIQCSLSGVSSVGKDDTNSKFLQLVENPEKPFELEVMAVQPNGLHEVTLINKDNNASVNEELAGKGTVSDCQGIEDKPAHLISLPLTIGETYDGQCGVASSPSQFWFSLNKHVDDLNNLLDEMAECYSSLGALDCVLSSPAIGACCCCQYSVDLGWYRAKIMSITGNQAQVCFVDFGNSEIVALNALKVLKSEYQNLPKQAICCSLNNATPRHNVWSKEAKTTFSDLVVEKDTVIKVVTKSSDDSYIVDLMDTNGNHFAMDMLIDKGFSALQQVAFQDFKPFALSSIDGNYIDVNPLYCVSPHKFHCQVLTQDNIILFNQMTNKLQEIYSCMGPSKNNIDSLFKGMPCCAHYSADNTWNRGRITQVNSNDSVIVKFVDYGNEETIPLNQVKDLLPEFLDIPVQCIECCLASVKPVTNNQWSDLAIKRFLELVDQKHLVGQVINVDNKKLFVELYDTQDDSIDVNVAQVLLSEGHAMSTSEPLVNSSHPRLSTVAQLIPSTGDIVYITSAESPESIFCQVSGTEERLDDLMANLKEFYESGQQGALQSISPNELCVALFSGDGAWYRAVAEEVLPGEVTVRFFDYGNTETMSMENVRAIDKQFLSEQILAVECKLAGVKPAGDDVEWSPQAAEFLAASGGDNGFVITIMSTADGLEVSLRDEGGELSQRLADNGLAKLSQSMPSVSNVDKSMPQTGNYKPTPVNIGTTMEVYITDVTSPGQFYCQLADYGDRLDEMMNSLCNHYNNMGQSVPCIASPKVGQPCVAIFAEDNMWYRAEIESLSQVQASVRFIDYGNTQNAQVLDLKQISDRFLELPSLAAECTIDPKKSIWTREETEKFKAAIGEEKLSAEIIGKEDGRYIVKISQDGHCLTDGFLKSSSAPHPEIPSQELQPNQTENVYVAFAKSSSEIFVQLASFSDQLDQVMATIEQEIKGQTTIKEGQVMQGMVCCAYFEDGWYRAVVTTKPNQRQVMVEYVDYGNTSTLPVSELKTVPESCVSLPRQAIHCILEGQGLENVTKEMLENTLMGGILTATFIKTDGQHWTVVLKQDGVDVVDILLINTEVLIKDLSFTDPEILAKSTAQAFVSHIENPGEFYVQMSSSSDKLDHLARKLNETYSQPGLTCIFEAGSICCAQFPEDNCWYRGIITSIQDDLHVKVHFVDYGNSEVVCKKKVMVLKEEFLDIPVLGVRCCLDKPGAQWSDEELNKFEALVLDQELSVEFLVKHNQQWHVKLTCDEISLLDLIRIGESKIIHEVQEDLTIQKKSVSEGQVLECGLSHLEPTGHFYLQFLGDPSLDIVTDKIASLYSGLGPNERCLNDCQVGSFCCVKFSEDNQWYRGVITELCSSNRAKVMFIDYGNSEEVSISSIKILSPDLAKIQQCSVLCKLAEKTSEWSQEVIKSLELQILDKTLSVTFVKPNEEGWDVEIVVEGKALKPVAHDGSKTETKSFSNASLLIGSREVVKFLMVDDKHMVWLQPVITENELVTLMNNIAENPPSGPMPLPEISAGKLCLCKFTEDDEWYRAQVVNFQDDQITVKYVDYGNTETVQAVRVSPINDLFLQLPAQAIHCSLYGVQVLSEDVIKKLNEEYVEVQLEVEVVERNDKVDCIRLFEGDKELISKLGEVIHDVACKKPVAAVSQKPLDEPTKEPFSENEACEEDDPTKEPFSENEACEEDDENKPKGVNQDNLENTLSLSDQTIDPSEDLKHGVDSNEDISIPSEEGVAHENIEHLKNLQPLDHGDSKNELETKNQIITELREEELAYNSQECDVYEDSVEKIQHSIITTSTEDFDAEMSCSNNILNDTTEEQKGNCSFELLGMSPELQVVSSLDIMQKSSESLSESTKVKENGVRDSSSKTKSGNENTSQTEKSMVLDEDIQNVETSLLPSGAIVDEQQQQQERAESFESKQSLNRGVNIEPEILSTINLKVVSSEKDISTSEHCSAEEVNAKNFSQKTFDTTIENVVQDEEVDSRYKEKAENLAVSHFIDVDIDRAHVVQLESKTHNGQESKSNQVIDAKKEIKANMFEETEGKALNTANTSQQIADSCDNEDECCKTDKAGDKAKQDQYQFEDAGVQPQAKVKEAELDFFKADIVEKPLDSQVQCVQSQTPEMKEPGKKGDLSDMMENKFKEKILEVGDGSTQVNAQVSPYDQQAPEAQVSKWLLELERSSDNQMLKSSQVESTDSQEVLKPKISEEKKDAIQEVGNVKKDITEGVKTSLLVQSYDSNKNIHAKPDDEKGIEDELMQNSKDEVEADSTAINIQSICSLENLQAKPVAHKEDITELLQIIVGEAMKSAESNKHALSPAEEECRQTKGEAKECDVSKSGCEGVALETASNIPPNEQAMQDCLKEGAKIDDSNASSSEMDMQEDSLGSSSDAANAFIQSQGLDDDRRDSEIKPPNGHVNGNEATTSCIGTNNSTEDDGCLSDSALEKLNNLLEGSETEEFSEGGEGRMKNKKSCQPM